MDKNRFVKIAEILIAISIILIIAILIISLNISKWCWIEIAYWIAGIIVPLITLASFFLVLATLQVQQEQLRVQNEEIQNTQEGVKQQNQTINLQRFENTFFLIVENLYNSYNKVLQSEPQHFKNVIKLLNEEIEKECESAFKDTTNLSEVDKRSYKAIYDGCLNTEKQYLNLGLGSIYKYFIQTIKLLMKSDSFIDNDKFYFDFIVLELDSDVLNLLTYMIIYHDEASILRYLNDRNFIDTMNSIFSPINLSRNRSMWSYISDKAGQLDPYSLRELHLE